MLRDRPGATQFDIFSLSVLIDVGILRSLVLDLNALNAVLEVALVPPLVWTKRNTSCYDPSLHRSCR